ncbi:hypothetical protein [Pendulispora albinea]|uniref:ABM domain-containing protein n=1 Tax=Pendulispora albinea TaxID=2741071 RepID=A0ABZ2M1G1_9BACT
MQRRRSTATSVIVHEVASNHEHAYLAWIHKITVVAHGFPGHIATEIVRPKPATGHGRPSEHHHFVTILRFRTEADAHRWLHSRERAALLHEACAWLVHGDRHVTYSDMPLWYQPPAKEAPTPGSVHRWKQWVMTAGAVFPLSVLVPRALGPIWERMGLPVEHLAFRAIGAAGISGIMVYWLMPNLNKRLGKWLQAPGLLR